LILVGECFFQKTKTTVVFVFSALFLCTKKAIAAEKLDYGICKCILFLGKCFVFNCLGLFCLLIPAEKLVWCEIFLVGFFFAASVFFGFYGKAGLV